MSAPPVACRPSGLDDPAELSRLDPGDMLGQVAGAGGQARVALRAAQAAPLVGPLPEVVVVAGMGGSGIAGDVLAALAFGASAVPVLAVKGDRLPAFVGPGTLLVAVSYSGNTAEQAALRLLDRLPVVWGSGQVGAVAATRFRTQCNENAKVSVVSGALPEADHNDVMGLEGGIGPGRELVLLRDEAGEHDRDGRRIQAAFTDFTSTYLGIVRGVDPTPIRTLDQVKAALAAGPERAG